MNSLRTALFLLIFAAFAGAQDAIIVLEETPEQYQEIDQVGASSRQSSARTSNAKQSYVIREMQRQAAAMGANAIVVSEMREWKEVKPVYGRRPGSMQYEDIIHYQGSGLAIKVDPATLEADAAKAGDEDGS
jgi:hypothetical protein